MKNSYIGFTAAAAFAALTVACGNQETQVIENFFRAVQAKDTGTVSSFAVVQFDREVKSWKVKSVGEEQRAPAPLAGLAKALKDADEAAAQNKKDASAYFNAHPLEVDKVKPLVEGGGKVPANLQKTADDWKKFTDTDKELKTKAADAKQAYEREKRLVVMSTGSSGDAGRPRRRCRHQDRQGGHRNRRRREAVLDPASQVRRGSRGSGRQGHEPLAHPVHHQQ